MPMASRWRFGARTPVRWRMTITTMTAPTETTSSRGAAILHGTPLGDVSASGGDQSRTYATVA